MPVVSYCGNAVSFAPLDMGPESILGLIHALSVTGAHRASQRARAVELSLSRVVSSAPDEYLGRLHQTMRRRRDGQTSSRTATVLDLSMGFLETLAHERYQRMAESLWFRTLAVLRMALVRVIGLREGCPLEAQRAILVLPFPNLPVFSRVPFVLEKHPARVVRCEIR